MAVISRWKRIYLVQPRIFCMDESGDQADEQQAEEKPIGIEEQKTIESQEAQAEGQQSTEDVNEIPKQQLKKL